ncbi:MAG: hypothetical protein F6K42_34370, partial [Leptolyngbya sp. SIO1D8]|nr:hypothetical protein [Leptolyngbya sp. SIO1D8]
MGFSSDKATALKRQIRQRLKLALELAIIQRPINPKLHRYSQRFLIGIVLGMLLVTTFGWFAPLLAQVPDIPLAVLRAQAVPDVPEANVPESEEITPDDNVEVSPPVIPIDIGDHWAASCIRELALRRMISLDDEARFYPDDPVDWDTLATLLNLGRPTDGAYAGANAAEAALDLPSPVNVLY